MDAPAVEFETLKPQHVLSVWKWFQEFPEANNDDFGPQTYQEFVGEIVHREMLKEELWIVKHKSPCGIIGYVQQTPRNGMFHGICYAKRVHGTGVPKESFAKFLKYLEDKGVHKVSAVYFADNKHIDKFLGGFGFEQEGLLKDHTRRFGKPVDMKFVSRFFEENK